jgi:hypothetical protein
VKTAYDLRRHVINAPEMIDLNSNDFWQSETIVKSVRRVKRRGGQLLLPILNRPLEMWLPTTDAPLPTRKKITSVTSKTPLVNRFRFQSAIC